MRCHTVSVPSKAKVPVEVERLNLKIPKGLHDELASILIEEQRWPSRQDFIIDAVREKLDRLRLEHPAPSKKGPR